MAGNSKFSFDGLVCSSMHVCGPSYILEGRDGLRGL